MELRSLPMELWEMVFEQLESDSLLCAANVCWAWNNRCLRLYLQINLPSSSLTPIAVPAVDSVTGISAAAVDSVSSQALQLQHTDTFPWSSRRVDAARRIENLEHLRTVVSRSRHIQQVTISFSSSSLDFHERGMSAHFCDVVHAMTQKTHGFVVMITDMGNLCVVERCYVAQWPRSHRPSGHADAAQRLAQSEGTDPFRTANFGSSYMFLPVGHDGHRAKSVQLHSVRLAEISAVHPAGVGQSFTLVKLNYEHRHWTLKIGCPCDDTKTWGSYEQLKNVLPYLHLPTLKMICIGVAIHPTAFTQFLRNNNGITQIELKRVPLDEQPHGEMLSEYPVVLPKLECLLCHAVEDLVPLLNSITLPDGTTISTYFDPFSDAPALRRALRRLSQHTLSVNLILSGRWAVRMPFDDEDLLIARALDCVNCIHMYVRAEEDIRAVIPWLACLPRLRTFLGMTDRIKNSTEDLTSESLSKEMRAALPRVAFVGLLKISADYN
ncbi:hypothetical protein DFH06DRAFT_1146639 [Mycena polygramma]|nr:hypothetical protein DFH06DRAFT_1146639 [Mycena polygramma]